MLREIGSLSSGTVAKLCGSGHYADIDTYLAEWQQFVCCFPGRKWETWQQCHDEYVAWLKASAPGVAS